MVAVSACMSGTRGSVVLSSTGDVLVRGVGGVCDMCMCLARGGVGGEGVSGNDGNPCARDLAILGVTKASSISSGVHRVSHTFKSPRTRDLLAVFHWAANHIRTSIIIC